MRAREPSSNRSYRPFLFVLFFHGCMNYTALPACSRNRNHTRNK